MAGSECPVKVVEPPSHDAGGGVGKVERVAQFVESCTETCGVVGPKKFPRDIKWIFIWMFQFNLF